MLQEMVAEAVAVAVWEWLLRLPPLCSQGSVLLFHCFPLPHPSLSRLRAVLHRLEEEIVALARVALVLSVETTAIVAA